MGGQRPAAVAVVVMRPRRRLRGVGVVELHL
jgi:hypothetical protein